MLDFGRTRAKVLHTPGHCPGHLCFHFPDQRLLFLADLDLVKAGPYYGDKASSIEDTISSLQRLAAIHVDVYLVPPANLARAVNDDALIPPQSIMLLWCTRNHKKR